MKELDKKPEEKPKVDKAIIMAKVHEKEKLVNDKKLIKK